MGFPKLIAAAMLATLLAACGSIHQLPNITDVEVNRAISEISAAPALEVYERDSAETRRLMDASTRRLTDAAQDLCKRLDADECEYDVRYDPSADMNAYAEGDNVIVLNQGLARHMESEDEIATIIAHEMGHHMSGHIEQTQVHQAVGMTVATIGLIALAVVAQEPDIINQSTTDLALDTGKGLGAIAYSKEQEREADYIAAYLLARAGYDLNKGRQVWVALTKASGRVTTGLLDTHPAGPDRLAAWDKAVAEVSASDDLLPNLKDEETEVAEGEDIREQEGGVLSFLGIE